LNPFYTVISTTIITWRDVMNHHGHNSVLNASSNTNPSISRQTLRMKQQKVAHFLTVTA